TVETIQLLQLEIDELKEKNKPNLNKQMTHYAVKMNN
ncbi:hypothetical protein AAUPMC_15485, partial [Pasteurella multocida subsp. multocida str. Anand1_cattle]